MPDDADGDDKWTAAELDVEQLDSGDLYINSEEDFADICAEAYVQCREHPDLDEQTAAEIADMVFELLTEWGDILGESGTSSESDYKVT